MRTLRHRLLGAVWLVLSALASSCSVATNEEHAHDAELPSPEAGTGGETEPLYPLGAAPDCTPSKLTDFMEAESWDVRRIEPHECALVRISTPVLSWVQPRDFDSNHKFAVRLTRENSVFDVTYSTVAPRLLVPDVLAAGTYLWTVTYKRTDGTDAVSQARRFVIAAKSDLLAIPTGATLVKTILAKSHPRALPSGSSFATVGSRASTGEYAQSYAGFLAAASAYLTAPITAVPPDLTLADFGNDKAKLEAWKLSLRNQSRDEVAAIETLGYAHHLTGNAAYRDGALARLRAIASWPPLGATSEANQDQVNREIYLVLALGLDLFHATLNTADRQLLVATLKQRLGQVLPKFSGLARYPYDSHLLTAVQYANEALMYAAGTEGFAEATDLLASTWEVMITTLGTMGSATDAGYGNGGAYGWYAAGAMARTMAAVRLMADVDLSRWPAAGRFGDNQIALTPPGVKLRGQFGDGAEDDSNYENYSFDISRLLASVTGNAQYEWYWRAKPGNVTYRFALMPMHYLMLGIPAKVLPPAPALPNSYSFEDAGVVAMHTKTDDPARTSVFFRSSRFGSLNHSHADNNAFTFVSRGKELLISGGYYDYYDSPHHALVTRATRFKNALTFDGGIGQAEPTPSPTAPGAPYFSMDARGQLVHFEDNGTWAVTTGDATLAYRGRDAATNTWSPLLSSAYRTVAFNRRERVVVIYDRARSASARTWELNFQTLQATSLVTVPGLPRPTLRLVNGTSSACVDVYAPEGTFTMTHGWPVVSGAPVAPTKTVVEQFQTRYAVTNPTRELTAVTVIREDCRAVPVQVSMPDGSTATIAIDNGAPLVADGLTVHVPPS
jgi:hypothetical protein